MTDTHRHLHAHTHKHKLTHGRMTTAATHSRRANFFLSSLPRGYRPPPPTLSGLRRLSTAYTQKNCRFEKRRVHRTVSVDKIFSSFSDFDGVAIRTRTIIASFKCARGLGGWGGGGHDRFGFRDDRQRRLYVVIIPWRVSYSALYYDTIQAL